MMTAQISHCHGSYSKSIRVRMPVKAKNAGRSRMVTTFSSWLVEGSCQAAVVGNHRPEQEGSEDGVDTDYLSGER